MPLPPLAPDAALLVRSTQGDTAVRRAHLRGDLVRLVAGRYLRREHWDALDDGGRHAMTAIAAVSCLRTAVVVSHTSAAALWGLPRLGSWPRRTHVIDPRLKTSTAGRYAIRHAGPLGDDEMVSLGGVDVTTVARTLVDIAVAAPFRQAVVSLDHAYRHGLATPDDLLVALRRRAAARGQKKAGNAIGFADGRANRPGESLSRVVMFEGGFADPELQRPFRGPRGQEADVDFFWESVGVAGEFDGETKYRDSERWSGLQPHEVVIHEKDRENWLRAHPDVRGFVRWTWREAVTPGALARLLREAGVPSA